MKKVKKTFINLMILLISNICFTQSYQKDQTSKNSRKQIEFHSSLKYFYHEYLKQRNDITKGEVYNQTVKFTDRFCKEANFEFKDWEGKVESITTSFKGDSESIFNVVLRKGDFTLVFRQFVTDNDLIFQTVRDLKKGDRVLVSGFFESRGGSVIEYSFTEKGRMSQPEFRIQFTSIKPHPIRAIRRVRLNNTNLKSDASLFSENLFTLNKDDIVLILNEIQVQNINEGILEVDLKYRDNENGNLIIKEGAEVEIKEDFEEKPATFKFSHKGKIIEYGPNYLSNGNYFKLNQSILNTGKNDSYNNTWYLVKIKNGMKGWIHRWYIDHIKEIDVDLDSFFDTDFRNVKIGLDSEDESILLDKKSTKVCYKTIVNLNLRKLPDVTSEIVILVPESERLCYNSNAKTTKNEDTFNINEKDVTSVWIFTKFNSYEGWLFMGGLELINE